MTYELHKKQPSLKGHIRLAGSKSISNRALIIRALCAEDFPIHHLANAKDTVTLQSLLSSTATTLDTGAAGTTFRFLTAYLCTRKGTQILTGSERMKERPIGVLVDALRTLGASIEYAEKENYPPLRIGYNEQFGEKAELSIPAHTSSQYISALLLLAPTLPNGLRLQLEGQIVSRPYIQMTLDLMRHFGIASRWVADTIHIAPQSYQARPFTVEADWSAVSYYYSMAALCDEVDLQLDGLFVDSVQGDAVVADIYAAFGIETQYTASGIHLSRTGQDLPPIFEYDFLECPDLAQTVVVTCAGLGITGVFTGLDTLRIKETDRIAALQTELAKLQSFLSALPPRFNKKQSDKQFFMLEGKAKVEDVPQFATYEDHRMAMAFAPLSILGSIQIEEPMVVVKSYPDFYEDLETLGVNVKPSPLTPDP